MRTVINKSEEFERYYQILGKEEDRIFKSMKDVMVFTALLALKNNIPRRPFAKKGGDGIKLEYFINSDDHNIINIIALYEIKDLSILTNEEQDNKLVIFEEYSNAGMKYLIDRFKQVPNEMNIREIITEIRPETKYKEKIDLADLIRESGGY